MRHRVPVGGARVHDASRRSCGRARGAPVNDWQFGDQHVRTKVYVLVPTEVTQVNVAVIPLSALRRPAQPPADPYDVAALLEMG